MRTYLPPSSLLWCALVISLPALCQRPGRSGIGLKAAAQWSTQRAEGFRSDPVPGAAAGIYFPLWCDNRFELQPELLISMQGASLPIPEGEAPSLRMLYAQLPINAKLYVSNALNAQFGLYGARLLSVRIDGDDVSSAYKAFDFGFTAGIGIDFTSGFDITARYNFGHTPVLAGDATEFPVNRVAHLSFGYRIARFSHVRNRRGAG